MPVERVTAELEPADGYFHIVNPFAPRFHMDVQKVLAEFDQREPGKAIRVTVTGQRYRSMADGSMKPVGPGAGKDTSQETVWEFTGSTLRDTEVRRLIRKVYQEKGIL